MNNIIILIFSFIFSFNTVFADDDITPNIPAYQGEVHPGITFNNAIWNGEGKEESHAIVPRISSDSPGKAIVKYDNPNFMPGPSGSPEIDSTFGPAYDELAHKGVFTFYLDPIDYSSTIYLEFDSGLENGKPYVWFLTQQTQTRPTTDSKTLGNYAINNGLIAYGICFDGKIAQKCRTPVGTNFGVDFSGYGGAGNRISLNAATLSGYQNTDFNFYWFYPGDNKATDFYFLMPHYYAWENSDNGVTTGYYDFDSDKWSMNEHTAWAERDYLYYFQNFPTPTTLTNHIYETASANYGYPLINPTEHDSEYIESGAGYTVFDNSANNHRPDYFYPLIYIDWTYLNQSFDNSIEDFNLLYVMNRDNWSQNPANKFFNYILALGSQVDGINYGVFFFDRDTNFTSSDSLHIDNYPDSLYVKMSPVNRLGSTLYRYYNNDVTLPIFIVTPYDSRNAIRYPGTFFFYRLDNYDDVPISPMSPYGQSIYPCPAIDYDYDPEYPEHPGDPDYPDRPSHPDYGGTTGDETLEDLLDYGSQMFQGYLTEGDKVTEALSSYVKGLNSGLDAVADSMTPSDLRGLSHAANYLNTFVNNTLSDMGDFKITYSLPLIIGIFVAILGV